MKQKDLQDSAKRAALGKLSGLVGIVCNVGLAGSKLAVGKLAGSMSITADGLNICPHRFLPVPCRTRLHCRNLHRT